MNKETKTPKARPSRRSVSTADAGGVKTAKPRRARAKPAAGGPPLLEEHFHDSELHGVRFELFNPGAREVFLAGTFNDWNPAATPMTRSEQDRWTATLMLRPGTYEYRFVVDGEWLEDPMAARFASNPFGALNSVCEVKAL